MGKGVGKKPRGGMMRAAAYTQLPPRPSNRCRETHEVPYTLRCVKSAPHSGFPHEDSEGRQW